MAKSSGTPIKGVIGKKFVNPFTPKPEYVGFTLANAKQLYWSMNDTTKIKGLKLVISCYILLTWRLLLLSS